MKKTIRGENKMWDSSKKGLLTIWEGHTVFVIGATVSIIFLIVFFSFQHNKAEVLNLETRWLIVSGVPILVALIIGGYIKSFKGFGVELEASLEKPVSNLSLSATEAITQVKGDEKRNISYLQSLSSSKKSTISRLKFTQGRVDYYTYDAIKLYFKELNHLKYVEICDELGKFIALIPMSQFRRRRNTSQDSYIDEFALKAFIIALENKEILSKYSDVLLNVNVQEDIGVIEALQIMKKKRINELIVLDDNNSFIGLLTLRSVEKKIIENILEAKEDT